MECRQDLCIAEGQHTKYYTLTGFGHLDTYLPTWTLEYLLVQYLGELRIKLTCGSILEVYRAMVSRKN